MTSSPPRIMESLILQLHDTSAVNFSSTTTSSPIHVDLSRLISSPSLLRQISQTLIPETLTSFDLLCPVPSTALPLATCLSTSLNVPMVIPRAALTFEGVFTAGQTCLVIDTAISSGESVIEAAAGLRAAGMKVVDAVAVVDGEEGAREKLAEGGIELHAIVKVSEVVRVLKANGRVSEEVEGAVMEFLREKNRKVQCVDDGVVETADQLMSCWMLVIR